MYAIRHAGLGLLYQVVQTNRYNPRPELTDFSLYVQHTKTKEMYQIPQNVQHGYKIYHIPNNHKNKPTRPILIYRDWYFLFENNPSGNPGRRWVGSCRTA
jgi:hypothetical protein